jgi:predicted secreted protein
MTFGGESMRFEESSSETVPVKLPNNALINIEVSSGSSLESVGFEAKSFQSVTNSIEGIAEAITDSLARISPSKASVKFGLEIQIEQGSLVAAIVRGKGKTNFEVTLEWEKGEFTNQEKQIEKQ